MRARHFLAPTLAVILVGACRAFSGIADLETESPSDPGRRDAQTEVDGGSSTDASKPSPVDATPDAPGCVSSKLTTILGDARDAGSFTELTAHVVGRAGGMLAPDVIALDSFEITFRFSITATGMVGAGLVFFVVGETPAALQCRTGPFICALGTTNGFGVLIRTAKGNASDPQPPYVAVVDALAFPGQQPTTLTPVTTTQVQTTVADTVADPPESSFRTIRIVVAQGKVNATLEGDPVLTDIPVPNFTPGFRGRWGIGASTGAASGAERNAIKDVVFNACP